MIFIPEFFTSLFLPAVFGEYTTPWNLSILGFCIRLKNLFSRLSFLIIFIPVYAETVSRYLPLEKQGLLEEEKEIGSIHLEVEG